MAFNFGAPQSSAFGAFGQNSGTTAFGATSTPAFGAASTPAFGAASTPAFGAASTPGFGASSTPAFGASSTPAFGSSSTPAFGASGTPGFGASSSAFSFAAASTPAFGAKPGNAFTFPSASAPAWPASTPGFGQLQPTQTGHQQQGQQQQQHQLSTRNNQPINDSTPWDDINEQSQQTLLQLERRILQYRNERQQLAACQRLQEGKESKQEMDIEHKVLLQALNVLSNVVRSDSDSIDSFRERVMQLLHHTEVAVMTAQRAQAWRDISKKVHEGQPVDAAERDRVLRLPITLPSNYLRKAIQQFQETLQQYEQLVQNLERVVQADDGLHPSAPPQDGDEPPLQIILHNVYRYLTAVAANLDRLHEGVADAKQQFLDKRKEEGDSSDPFAEADRREREQRKAEKARSQAVLTFSAAQRQAAGPPPSAPQATSVLFGSAAAFGQSSSAAGGMATTGGLFGAATGAAFGTSQPAAGGLFGSSQPAAAASGGMFSMPPSGAAPSLFGAPAASGAAFGAPQTPNPSPFGGTPQTPTAFGAPFGGGFGSQSNFNKQPVQSKNSKTGKSSRR
ncbi:hypothetical protein ABBQ32_014043 [Trebouxia sp. C0010 RCD-2024]